MLTCLALLLTMMPAGIFAENEEDALQEGLYWRETERSKDDSGNPVFEAVGELSDDDIVGEPNGDAIREFVYVDENGYRSTVKFASLT